MTELTMNDGRTIPALGYGTYKVTGRPASALVAQAIELGYRHVDTAAFYGNESAVGRGIAQAAVARSDIFVTTKLWPGDQADPARALATSLKKLGLDYVDLYLMHWPAPARGLYVSAWAKLAELRSAGLAKSIGVSNFLPEHLAALEPTGVVPAVNQIEIHPSYRNDTSVAANTARGIVTEAYMPLGRAEDLSDPVIAGMADRLGVTPAQVILAWLLAKDYVVIPKTTHPERMRANLAAADLTLTTADLAAMDDRPQGRKLSSDPARFNG